MPAKTYKAVNIYTYAEDVFTVEGEGAEAIYVDSAGDRWRPRDFFNCWRTEGSQGYDRAVRYKRQKAEREAVLNSGTLQV
jgi:hypothetical protein